MAVQDRFTPRNVYLYVVCLIMLLVALFAAVQLVQSAIGIAYPEASPEYGWTAYAPLDEGSEYLSSGQLDEVTDAQREHEIRETVASAVTLLLAGGIYVLHWRRAKTERSAPATAEVPAGPPAP